MRYPVLPKGLLGWRIGVNSKIEIDSTCGGIIAGTVLIGGEMGVVPHIPDKQCVDSGGYVLQCAMGIPVLDPLMVLRSIDSPQTGLKG